ncbi:Sodium-coupled monocarboxylate transporter 1 like protein [Argiope bruennichi]|uniref:Sodium-coupled monocarboxylate transporter 1 like protein n=1 Tax=Argiope bruennichi TaxID=94029 RepID=A0A8T0E031_ARGBR|nr:Sodium-coupled monocarboxylate transporter 1 like protein [Argiope bruennichi]
MAQLLGIVDYIVIAITLALSTLIGLYFRFSGGRQKTTNEFLMGNQNVHILPVAVSIIATSLSSVSVLGVPAEMYLHGTQYVITGLGIPLGGLLAAYGFLPVFYEMQVSTAYQYLEKRFGKTIRTFVATLYTFLTGGLKAVVWTVVFQSALMYLAMVALIVKISMMLGFNEVFDIARRGGRFIFFEFSGDLTERYTFWNSFAYGFTFWLLLYGSNQSTIQRFLSVGSLRKAQQ